MYQAMHKILYFALPLSFISMLPMELQVPSHISREAVLSYQSSLDAYESIRVSTLKHHHEVYPEEYPSVEEYQKQKVINYQPIETVKSLKAMAASRIAKLLMENKFDASLVARQPADIQEPIKQALITQNKKGLSELFAGNISYLSFLTTFAAYFSNWVFRSDGKYALLGEERHPELWDFTQYPTVSKMLLRGGSCLSTHSSFSKSGLKVLSGDFSGSLSLWNLKDLPKLSMKILALKPNPDLTDQTKRITFTAISPDEKYAISSSNEGETNVWQIDGQEVRSVQLPNIFHGLDEYKLESAEFISDEGKTHLRLTNKKNKSYNFSINQETFEVVRTRMKKRLQKLWASVKPVNDNQREEGFDFSPTVDLPKEGPLIVYSWRGNKTFVFRNVYELADKLSLQELVAKAQSLEKK